MDARWCRRRCIASRSRVKKAGSVRIYKFWEDRRAGATNCLLDVPKGASIPIRPRHASNQFIYCIEGVYEYVDPGLVRRAGSFYMNPKGNPHGPTVARTRCLLLEIYDGLPYLMRPSFHTAATVRPIAGAKRVRPRVKRRATTR